MRNPIFYIILIFTPFLFADMEISFESESKIKKEDQAEEQTLKSGEVLQLKNNESIYAVTQKGIPLLIVSPKNENSKMTVLDAQLEHLLKDKLTENLNNAVNDILSGLRQVDILIFKRDYTRALAITNQLKLNYKNVADIYFTNATLLHLTNNKTAAVEDLEKGLLLNPKNLVAQELLNKLKGNK